MKAKKVVALLLAAMMMLGLVGCNLQTKPNDDNPSQTQGGGTTNNDHDPVSLKLLYTSSDETYANVLRDELSKAGFNVEMSAAADGATFREQEGNGNFDIAIVSWANPVGTPDYGCRGIWHSNGDSNLLGINDPKLDELVVKASTETSDVYVQTYGEAERYAIGEMSYMVPLFVQLSGRGFNNVLVPETITANQRWEHLAYVDASQTDTRTLVITQTGTSFSTWDCIRVDDQSSGYSLDEMYIHLLTLEPDWSVTTKESLSYSYAISEDNTGYYFLLRDDCGFARIDKNGNVYDSGVKVSGEDVVYSLNRAMDPNSTPMHATYSMYENMKSVEIVTDIAELENTKVASGKSVKEALEAEGQTIDAIVAGRDEVDNAAGKYQVVKCTTSVPYPQILNCLTFHGAGIVDSEFVEAMNKDVDIANYDATKDRLYGDSVCTVEGATYDNHLSLSGNYVLTSMNDYQLNFVANPCIRTNDKDRNPIKTITLKLIQDRDAALSALRSGEVDFPYALPTTKYDLVEQDPNLGITYMPGIRAYMVGFNMHGNSEVSNSADLRKAIASVINYEDFSAVQAGNTIKIYSPIGTCLDCGNELNYQTGDTQKYLDAYFASK